jgi:hypothetical protein
MRPGPPVSRTWDYGAGCIVRALNGARIVNAQRSILQPNDFDALSPTAAKTTHTLLLVEG